MRTRNNIKQMCFSDMLISLFLSSILSLQLFCGGKRRSSVILIAEEPCTAGK